MDSGKKVRIVLGLVIVICLGFTFLVISPGIKHSADSRNAELAKIKEYQSRR